jgi:hypothetical protein
VIAGGARPPENVSSRQACYVCLTTVRVLSVLLIAPALVLAQRPRVGALDFYGVHTVSEARIRKALGFREGDPLPSSKVDVEERLEKVPGVVLARLEAVCCDGERAILYVGIEERGAQHFEYRPPPDGASALPAAVVDTYRAFLRALEEAARAGRTGESFVQGHALADDPAARAYQEQFVDLAEANLESLRHVLRESSDAGQRAIAAYLIGYAPLNQPVVNDLQYAMQDADESVRTHAMRSLSAIAALASRSPDLGIRVQLTWFVEMLNSLVWSDRQGAASALAGMTGDRDESILAQIRERALPAVVEMARWKTLSHALPAFLLAGRIAGLPEKDIHDAWTRGDREPVIRRALGLKPPRKKGA